MSRVIEIFSYCNNVIFIILSIDIYLYMLYYISRITNIGVDDFTRNMVAWVNSEPVAKPGIGKEHLIFVFF